MLYQIYVPSKQRPQGKTFNLWKGVFSQKHLFLEKEDVPDYQPILSSLSYPPRLHVLPLSGQGIAYARAAIQREAETQSHGWYWVLDDDIIDFFECQSNGKLVKVTMEQALQDAQNIITSLPSVAQGALNYAQFAFGKGKPFSYDKRCLIATLNNTERLRLSSYDPKCTLKEDIDFTLQILSRGLRTVLCNKIAFSVPVYGTLKGGCFDIYQKQYIEKHMSEYLEKKWGRHIIRKVLKENGRYDVKINWSHFKKKNGK